MRALIVVAVLASCGGPKAREPEKPKPPDAGAVAAQVEGDMVELGQLAHRSHRKCPELIASLQPLVARMQRHYEEVKRLEAEGLELKSRVRAYDAQARGRTEQIGTELGETYLTCDGRKQELKELIDRIPTFE
ncbi:MAG: hypothetical protein ABI867_31145 [Kofleriaceae bacterium]